MRCFTILVAIAAIGLSHVPNAAESAAEEVDLELVLLADATGSIDDAEILFQREGYAKAIADPAVISAIGKTLTGRIAITYVEWGDYTSQDVVVDWTIVDGKASADAFASALLEPPRRAFGRNAIAASFARRRRIPLRLGPSDALQVPRRVLGRTFPSAAYVAWAHREGIDVHVWTVDDEAEMHRLLDIGVDGIMTDRPSVLKRVFEERGLPIAPP